MVAIVAGNGLGLFNTSLNTLGGMGAFGQGNLGQAGGQALVNAATGNLILQFTDEQLSGLGRDLLQIRTYNTQGLQNDADGDGWRWDGERRVVLTGTRNTAGSTLTRTNGDGHEAVYVWTGTRYQSTDGDGAHDTLVWHAASSEWVWTDGSRRHEERYSGSHGRILSSSDANGTSITYGYDANGRLNSIKDSSGQELVLVYNASGKLARLDTRTTEGGALTRQVYYGYDAQGRLSSVSTDLTPEDNSIADGQVYTTQYTYDGSSFRIASVSQSDGTSVSFTYQLVAGAYRVHTVVDASGSHTFTYDTANRRTNVSNGLGQVWTYHYDTSNRLTEVQTPAVDGQRLSTRYAYDAQGNVIRITDGLGNAIDYSYDANGNRVLERDAQGNTLARTYNSANQLLNEIRFSQPATWNAGTSSWTNPPESSAQVTRHIYDADNRLRYRISPTSELTEFRYNASGLLIQEFAYNVTGFSVSVLTPSATVTLSQLSAIVSTLDKTQARLTNRQYDYRGNLTLSATYGTVDASGVGVVNNNTQVTQYVYSEHGQLLQTIAIRGEARNQATVLSSTLYDGMGRVLAEVDGSGSRQYLYQGATRSVAMTTSTGLTRTQTYDSHGRLISITDTAAALPSRTLQHVYDAAGRLTMQEDAAGARSYTFYDQAGRISGVVDALGGVTEFVYDAAGQRTQTIQYAQLVSTGSWFNGSQVVPTLISQIRPVAHADDRMTSSTYDSAGRLASSTDAAGVVTQYSYNTRGQLLQQQTGDRITRFFYNEAGRQTAQLDGEGYLTENRYNGLGQVVSVIQYGQVTNPALRATGSLEQLRPASGDNLASWNFFDSAGRQVGQINAQGFVTETRYDEANNTQTSVSYLNHYSGTLTTSTDFATVLTALASSPTQTTELRYDSLGRIAERLGVDGTLTSYEYDSSGRLIKEVLAAGTAEARTSLTRYDAFNQVIGKLTGEAAARILPGMSAAQIQAIYAEYGLTYSYDAAGRVATVKDSAGNLTASYYDATGRLTHVINALGEVTEQQYNRFGEVTERIQFTNRLSPANTQGLTGGLLTQPVKALVQAIRSAALDNSSSYVYDNRGLLVSSTNALGYQTSYSYNIFSEQASIVRSLSSTQTVTQAMAYNKRGELIARTDDVGGLNRTSSTTYDAFGRVISQTDALGKVSTTQYDHNGRLITTTDPLNHSRSSSYDAFGRVLHSTDALGRVTSYQYDDLNRSISVTTPDGVTVTTLKNRHGQTLSVTDGTGAVSQFSYNRDGQVLTKTDALNQVTSNLYDDAGRLLTVTDALGRSVGYSYDAANRIVSRTDAAGTVTSYTFDGQGRQVRVVEAQGLTEQRTTDYHYDQAGQTLRVIHDPNGLMLTTSYSYDGIGQQTEVRRGTLANPNQQSTVYSYDTLGRRVSEQSAAGSLNLTTHYSYDANDRVIRKVDANGAQTDYVYDDGGRLRFTVNAEGYVTERRYDAAGNLVGQTQYNNPWQFSRDQAALAQLHDNVFAVDNLLANPGFNNAPYGIPVSWNVQEIEWLYSNTIVSGLESNDRAFFVAQNPFGPAPESLSISQVIEVIEPGKTYAFSADVHVTNAATAAMIKWYDQNGQLISTSSSTVFDQGSTGSNSHLSNYTTLFVEASAPANAASAEVVIASTIAGPYSDPWVYIAQPTFQEVQPAGMAFLTTSPNDRSTAYVYDANNRLQFTVNALNQVSETRYDAAGRVIESLQYDQAIAPGTESTAAAIQAALVNAGASARSTSYVYDAAGQLSQTTDAAGKVESYTYDSVGNRLTLTNKNGDVWHYNYDNLNRLVEEITPSISVGTIASDGSVSSAERLLVTRMDYDALGNVISRSEGRLRTTLAASAAADDVSQARTTTYAYDSLGRQVQITSPGWYNKTTGRYQQGPDLSNPANTFQVTTEVTYDSVGNAVRNRVRVNNTGVSTTDFVDSFKVYDQLGRVTHDIDALKGVTAYTHDAMGNVLTVTRYNQALNLATPARGYYLAADITSNTLPADGTQDRTLINTYDQLGRKVSVQQDTVGIYRFTGNVNTSTLQTLTPTTVFSYNAYGELIKESQLAIDAQGNTAQTGASTVHYYDKSGNRIGSVDALGRYTLMEYDALGQLMRQIEYATSLSNWSVSTVPTTPVQNAQTRITRYSHDAMGRVTEVTLENVRYWEQSVNPANGTVSTSQITGSLVQSTNVYDNIGNLISTTDAQGNSFSSHYNAVGHVTEMVEPLTTAAGTQVNPFAQAEVLASPTTQFIVNAFGQVISSIRSAGRDAANNEQAGQAQTTRTEYDAAGYEVREIRADNSIVNFKVDAAGRRIEESQSVYTAYTAWTEQSGLSKNLYQTIKRNFSYDALGQQTDTIDWYTAADGSQQSTVNTSVYNRFGEVTEKRLNGHLLASYSYDQTGRLSQQQDNQGVTAFDYDLSGAISRVNQLGNLSTSADDRITYHRNDVLGRVLEQHLPAFDANLNSNTLTSHTLTLTTPIIRQTYDRWGNVLSHTDANSRVTYYSYDHNNQILTEAQPSTTIVRENGTSYFGSLTLERRYDALGRMIQEVDRVGTNELRSRHNLYNAAGQLVREVDALGFSRQYRYDAHGNRIATQDAVGNVLVDSYDSMNRQISHGVIRNGDRVTLMTKQYDQAGRLYGEISGPLSYGVEETLVSTQNSNWSGTDTGAIGNIRYTLFDERGNITATRNESKIERHFEYDDANRKIKETDALGNTLTWTYNDADFGRLASRKDLGGTVYSYEYNGFGQVQKELSGLGYVPNFFVTEDLFSYRYDHSDAIYEYYSNGLLRSITKGYALYDSVGTLTSENTRSSTYAYDKVGNKVRETNTAKVYLQPGVVSLDLGNGLIVNAYSYAPDQSSLSDTFYRYDQKNRLVEIKSPAGTQLVGNSEKFYSSFESGMLSIMTTKTNTARVDSLKYSYDEFGNRRQVYMDSTSQGGTRKVIDDWYKYDLADRVIVTDGFINTNGQIVAGKVANKAKGELISYDAAGRRLSSERWVSSNGGIYLYNNQTPYTYTYHAGDKYLRSQYGYNDQGQVASISTIDVIRPQHTDSNSAVTAASLGYVSLENTYDEKGRKLSEQEYKIDGEWGFVYPTKLTTFSYRGDSELTSQLSYKSEYFSPAKLTQATYFNEAGMRDATGKQTAYRYVIYKANGTSISYRGNYTTTYAAYDTYKESTTVATWTQAGTPGKTTFTYDSRGELKAVVATGGTTIDRMFASNADGQITTRRIKSGKAQSYLYHQGAALANYGNITAAEITDTFTRISSDYPAATPGTYVVNQGDTLAGIAQSVWGDSGMWYLIADANGLTPDVALVAGSTITIPNVVSSNHNKSTTFKPYNPSDVILNTTPSPKPPPPPSGGKCGGIAAVVMVVVAVVATVFTAGLASTVMAGGWSALGTGLTSFTTTMGLGTTALAGGTWGAVGAAVIGGAVGSAASQLAGMAMGVVDSFSWRQVAAGGLSAGVGAGVGTYVTGGRLTTELIRNSDYGKVAASAILNAAGSHAANKIAGLDSSFSWASIASATISSLATAGISKGLNLTTDNFKSNLLNGLIGGQVSAFTRKFMGIGGKIDQAAIAADAFGNAIGNGLIEASLKGGSFFGPKSGPSQRQMMVQMSRPIDLRYALASTGGGSSPYSNEPPLRLQDSVVYGNPDSGDSWWASALKTGAIVGNEIQSALHRLTGLDVAFRQADKGLAWLQAVSQKPLQNVVNALENPNDTVMPVDLAALYAVNRVTAYVANEGLEFLRLTTNDQKRFGFGLGLASLLSTNPVNTLEQALNGWASLPSEDRNVAVAGLLVSFPSMLRKVGSGIGGVPDKNSFSPLGELGEFETLGLPAVTPTRNVLSDTIEGRMLVRQYRQAGMSESRALEFAARDIQSGTSLPSIGLQNSGDSFYKLVPSGNTPGRSSYYLSSEQYSGFKSGYDDVFDNLSLPDGSVADAYDVYRYSVKQGSAPLSFTSEIAPSMSSSQGLRTGGFGQTVIPNSNALEMQELIETLSRSR